MLQRISPKDGGDWGKHIFSIPFVILIMIIYLLQEKEPRFWYPKSQVQNFSCVLKFLPRYFVGTNAVDTVKPCS